MFAKKLICLVLALGFLSSTGCCRMWENWCQRPNYYQGAPAPYCPPAPPMCPCPPGYSGYSSPAPGAVPVPAAPNGNWNRCP